MSIRRAHTLPPDVKDKLDKVVAAGGTPKLFMELSKLDLTPPNYSWYKLRRVISTGRAHSFEINMLQEWFNRERNDA